MGEIISITSQKGGVGKTTTTINLAACLSELGFKVLIIDIDPQGHIATSFKKEKYDINGGIIEFILNHHEVNTYIHMSPMKNMDFIPSNICHDDENKIAEFSQQNSLFLKQPLGNIEKLYDFIFIDCPPSLNKLTYNAVAASNSIIVPVQCEFYALKALSRLLKMVQEIKQNVNPGLEYKGFLLTMVDLRSNLQQLVFERIQYNLKGLVFETFIPRNIRLAEVPYHGKPAIMFDRNSKGTKSYVRLTKELLNQRKTIESTLSKTNFKLAENY